MTPIDFRLLPVPGQELEQLAAGQLPARVFVEAAVPPAFVALRALRHLAAGKPAHWCSTFYIVDTDQRVLGGCGFKDVPVAGQIEIGYALAPACRGQGLGKAVVAELLSIAFASDAVQRVLACIVADNHASIGVVRHHRFIRGECVVDEEGEAVWHWVRARTP